MSGAEGGERPRASSEALVGEFSHQAEAFDVSPVMRLPETLAAVVEMAPADPSARWLEAACGGGLVARELARRVGSVHGVDLTPAMIAVAEREAARLGIGNVSFAVGDATALDLPEGGFDGAITRFSLHHMPAPSRMLGELRRLVRAGGAIVIADHVTVEEPEAAAWHQQIERLRDPSHWACLTPARLRALGEAAGLELELERSVPLELDYVEWLERGSGGGDAELIEAAVAEPPGTAPSFRIERRPDGVVLGLTLWASRWRVPA